MKRNSLIYSIFVLAGLIWSFSCNYDPHLRGKELYAYYCANCHMEAGEGLRGLIPPLANSDYLQSNRELLPCIIRKGMEGEIVVNGKTYNQPMASIPEIGEADLANLINYINMNWGNEGKFMSHEEVVKYLEACD